MQYENVIPAEFLARPNRFIAEVSVSGRRETVHVKNTGRCRELLVPGCRVWLSVSDDPARKTKYDLIAVEKQRKGKTPLLINMDSQIPNSAAAEWLPGSGLFSRTALFRRESVFGKSRFDFQITEGDRTGFLEVKGVTLEQNGIAMFPDAPTGRGVKHLHELVEAVRSGYGAFVLFVIQMKGVREFRPNGITDPDFAEALRYASENGVRLLAFDCIVTPDSMTVDKPVMIRPG